MSSVAHRSTGNAMIQFLKVELPRAGIFSGHDTRDTGWRKGLSNGNSPPVKLDDEIHDRLRRVPWHPPTFQVETEIGKLRFPQFFFSAPRWIDKVCSFWFAYNHHGSVLTSGKQLRNGAKNSPRSLTDFPPSFTTTSRARKPALAAALHGGAPSRSPRPPRSAIPARDTSPMPTTFLMRAPQPVNFRRGRAC